MQPPPKRKPAFGEDELLNNVEAIDDAIQEFLIEIEKFNVMLDSLEIPKIEPPNLSGLSDAQLQALADEMNSRLLKEYNRGYRRGYRLGWGAVAREERYDPTPTGYNRVE